VKWYDIEAVYKDRRRFHERIADAERALKAVYDLTLNHMDLLHELAVVVPEETRFHCAVVVEVIHQYYDKYKDHQ
jgi:hypothetical protein